MRCTKSNWHQQKYLMYQDSILLPRWFFVCLHYPLLDIFPLKLWGGGGVWLWWGWEREGYLSISSESERVYFFVLNESVT